MRNRIINEYYEWLYDLVCKDRYYGKTTFKRLLQYLHNTPFRYSILRDENRAEDGLTLRYRFACEHSDIPNADDYITGPCSVLEMMVALALHCEEDIMDDPYVGDRTKQWFWGMIINMGLGSMSDDRFDRRYVGDTVERFLDRDYEPNGRGGLFTIRDCDCDVRNLEIWQQLCWYLDSMY